MQAASLTPDEEARIALLTATGLLDSDPEEVFDRITRLAAQLLDSPIAAVSLIDRERQWFKSAVGLGDVRETPRTLAFCAHAIHQRELFLVPDATQDARFAQNALVTSAPHIRFYAGMPLVSSEGVALGTLCVIDIQPRRLDDAQAQLLQDLAALVRRELLHREMALKAQLAMIFHMETDLLGQGPRFKYVSDGVAALVGRTPADLVADAQLFFGSVLAEDRRSLEKALVQSAAARVGGKRRFRLQALGQGSAKWMQSHISPTFQTDRIVWSGYVSDVHREQQAHQRLQENERLKASATLASGVAHEFNNMLGSIMGLTELTLHQLGEGSQLRRNLERVLHKAQQSSVMVKQLQDFTGLHQCEHQPYRLGQFVSNRKDALSVFLPQGVVLECELNADPAVQIDAAQFEQVLTHLVSNAGQAMTGRSGCVRIVVDVVPASMNPLKQPAAHVRVIDTGEGIDEDVLPHVFVPFFTTKAVGEGTGLGLCAARGVVLQHQGSIDIASVKGQGCEARIWLPVLETA